jgi:outer membrane protein assembly factor BamD
MALSWRRTTIVIIAVLAVGCTSTNAPTSKRQPLGGTDEQMFSADTIKKNHDPTVMMKRAESFFEKEEYPEAIIEYQHFLTLHRMHTLASYAQYKLAESHFKQIKDVDRDPDPIHKALEAFEKLQKDYTGSRYDRNAVERIAACHRFIAEVHLIVGQFYYRRDAFLAAAHRFERILTLYPEIDIAGEALYYLALTYKDMGAENWAREQLIALAERFPSSPHAASGQKMIASLNHSRPTEPITKASNLEDNRIDILFSLNGALPRAIGTPSLAPLTSQSSHTK